MSADFPIKARVDDKDLVKLINALRKTGREAGMTEKEIDEIEKSLNKMGDSGEKNINKINKNLDGLNGMAKKGAALFAGMFAIDKIKEFIGKTVEVTAEFQRLQAVLNNALGSQSAGQAAFNQILNFAKATPYAVSQITDSFNKLVNRGIKPTTDQLRSLGDIAASQGKQLDQVTEALLDAMTGEFERLKEFGIKAKSEGDKVTFTFKGVETQVDKTEEAIGNYIFALGEAEGVSGAMTAISQTLGGKISNLGDSFDQFFFALGSGTSNEMTAFIDKVIEAVDWVTTLIEGVGTQQGKAAAEVFEEMRVELEGIGKTDIPAKIKELNEQLEIQRRSFEGLNEEYVMYQQEADKNTNKLKNLIGVGTDYNKLVEDQEAAMFNAGVEMQATELAVSFLEERMKELSKETKKANTELGKVKVPELLEGKNPRKEADQFRAAIERNFGKDFFPNFEKLNKDALDQFDATMKEMAKANKKSLDEQLKQQEKYNKAVAELRDSLWQAGEDLLDREFERDNIRTEEKLAKLNEDRDRDLAKVGENEEAKELVRKKYAEEEKKLKREQDKKDQDQALFKIAIETAIAAAKAVAASPVTFGQPFLSFAIAQGLLQAALVKSAPLPKYKDGVFDLQGAGTETSDSIPAMLSKRESVVPAHRSKAYGWLLKPMIEDGSFNEMKLRQLVDDRIPSKLRGDIMVSQRKSPEEDKMSQELNKTLRELARKQSARINVDKDGFNIFLGDTISEQQYFNNRYSSGV